MKKYKLLIGVFFYNEENKIDLVLNRFKNLNLKIPFGVVFMNDGSTDNTPNKIINFIKETKNKKYYKLLSNSRNMGVGYSIARVIRYGLKNKYDIFALVAGNGKDNPVEISKLIKPIIKDNYDYVQGSRFLKGGSYRNLPPIRFILTKLYTLLVNILTNFKGTDSSNGFRAYKLSLLKNKLIDINQSWLNRYELEMYLHYKFITLGYRTKEVPVSKDYPANLIKYSKMKPFIDWWRMIRPLIFLRFGIKN